MKKNIFLLSALFASAGAVMAQDSYDAANFATSDLNGTSRYVSMGGALGALGADVSAMSNNPAGAALFRRNETSMTVSSIGKSDGVLGHDGRRLSIDNMGLVVSIPVIDDYVRNFNFGVNYTKNKNFLSNVETSIDHLGGMFSQTHQFADLANRCEAAFGYMDDKGDFNPDFGSWGTAAYFGTKNILNLDESQPIGEGYSGVGAQAANYKRATYGGINQVDANMSLNVLDKYFFGISATFADINYNRESFYEELGTDGTFYDISNWYTTSGEGVGVKFGFICRPIDESSFRFGVAVHTPTWYLLEDYNGATMYVNDNFAAEETSSPYNYNYRTPWKFNASLGYTIGNYVALGAEYEYSDLTTSHYSEDGRQTTFFRAQNQFIKDNLSGQHTFKLGLESKPTDNFSVRAGYNYVSSPFKDAAYRVIGYDGPFTETDFTNWKAINRYTFGVGFRFKGGYLDLAYQYSAQKGDFYAFDDIDLVPTTIENNRSQVSCTLGLRF